MLNSRFLYSLSLLFTVMTLAKAYRLLTDCVGGWLASSLIFPSVFFLIIFFWLWSEYLDNK